MTSGNTFRVRIDGSHVDQFSFGQVNPFGMTFDPRGDMFTADCHSRPGMLVLRGGCYSSFGKPHDGLGFAPEIMTHEHGSTGIAGIVYYTGGPLAGRVSRHDFPRQPGHGHHQPRSHHDARVDPFRRRAARLHDVRRLVVPARRFAIGDRRLDLRRRLLQLHHRPLRGAADASAPRQNAGPHLEDLVRRKRRPHAATQPGRPLASVGRDAGVVALERQSAHSDLRDTRIG